MSANDVQVTLQLALDKTGLDQVLVEHRPRLLSDNGSCYLSKDLKDFLDRKHMEHTRGAPYHPMTQGKIERYHRSMKNIVNLQNYFLPRNWSGKSHHLWSITITSDIMSRWTI